MIDIRELRIGSHVSLKGERVEVEEIDNLRELVGFKGIYFKRDGERYNEWYRPQDLEPIPITEELLTELMPKDRKSEHCGDIHSFAWDFGEYRIAFMFFGEINVVEISRKEENHFIAQVCNIEHLHELEAFVYLTTKQELI